MVEPFDTVTQSEAEGTYALLPPESGFEAGEDVAIEQIGAQRRVDREAIASSNAYVEKHGLPLAQYRHF